MNDTFSSKNSGSEINKSKKKSLVVKKNDSSVVSLLEMPWHGLARLGSAWEIHARTHH